MKTNYHNYPKEALIIMAVTGLKPEEIFTQELNGQIQVIDDEDEAFLDMFRNKSKDELATMLEEGQKRVEENHQAFVNSVKLLVVGHSDEEVFEIFDEIKAQREQEKAEQYAWRNNIVKQLNEDRKRQKELGIIEELTPVTTVRVNTLTGEEEVVKVGPMPS